jgi:hypothetical protein
MNKDVNQLIKTVRKVGGFEIGYTKRHVVVTNVETGERAILPKTPSDSRWRKNAVADLKRIGFILPR